MVALAQGNLLVLQFPADGVGRYRGLGLEIVMSQVDPWEKAADCERAMRISLDPTQREDLANIREFWISLANARPFLSESEFIKEAETIARFHANL